MCLFYPLFDSMSLIILCVYHIFIFPISARISGGRNSLSFERIELPHLEYGVPAEEPDGELVRNMHSREFIFPHVFIAEPKGKPKPKTRDKIFYKIAAKSEQQEARRELPLSEEPPPHPPPAVRPKGRAPWKTCSNIAEFSL